jgi:hypothetical protein
MVIGLQAKPEAALPTGMSQRIEPLRVCRSIQLLRRCSPAQSRGGSVRLTASTRPLLRGPPISGGLSFWTTRIDGGADLSGVASGLVASSEFRTVHGANPTNNDIVGKFYQNVLNRAGEPGGVNFWVGELNNGSRTVLQVLAGFSESAENK